MGGVNSCFIPRGEFDRSARTSTPKEKGHRRNLSATFNMSVVENSTAESSLVNVNKASEEELMTLPGVNRAIAKSIVDYRNHIGGFRRVEDVALTPGVGAVKLAMMCSEIYVDSPLVDERVDGKQNSGSQQQKSSEPVPAICINSSNIFKLMRVQGVGMAIAKNIVAYRQKHGRYKKVDELLNVKGIGVNNFEEIRSFCTIEDKQETISKTDEARNGIWMNGSTGNKAAAEKDQYIVRSTSSLENLLEILGPLAKVPERPKVDKVTLTYKKCPVFRLTSWNLDKFSLEKASNPGVKDVICMTLLENGFGLVAVQELGDKEALHEICRELNSPALPNVRKWTGRRGQWSCVVSEAACCTHPENEYHGFLYDTSQNIELIKSRLLESGSGEDKTSSHSPFFGLFRINKGLQVAVVNVNLKTASLSDDDLSKSYKEHLICDITDAATREVKGETVKIILGDFNQISNAKKVSDDLETKGYVQCIPAEAINSSSESHSLSGAYCGNIWVSKEAKDVYTGVCGIVREGLSSSWIPSGWSWGGLVSNDCPVYVQLYSTKDFAK